MDAEEAFPSEDHEERDEGGVADDGEDDQEGLLGWVKGGEAIISRADPETYLTVTKPVVLPISSDLQVEGWVLTSWRSSTRRDSRYIPLAESPPPCYPLQSPSRPHFQRKQSPKRPKGRAQSSRGGYGKSSSGSCAKRAVPAEVGLSWCLCCCARDG
jgi:hypothetical protein